ncbi:serine hydrolase domain-containing protein [Paenibacillus mesotrionivorans]|uniref:Serine hydrolase domain-containing protein n=1 Tax=Paenibacillus mesotrionivorans TaxID=3160968 RepID=A0ACC7P0M5_9BACL
MDRIHHRLDRYMRVWEEAGQFSGTVLVAQGEQVLLHQGYGFANLEFGAPNTAATIYKIASITKLFTAAAVLQLHDQGKLALEEDIAAYVPEYRHGGGITVHHLLSHASGIPDYTALPEYTTRIKLSPEVILRWLNDHPPTCGPGERTEKSNSNYVLLARIVEQVSGLGIEEYYSKNLFGPAGLGHTGVCRNGDVIPGMANGYSVSGEGAVHADYYEMTGAYGSGFLYSTAGDLLQWTKALGSGQIISGASYGRMTSAYGFMKYLGAYAGYGCLVKGNPAEELVMDGNIYGYTCTVHHLLQEETTVIVLANNDAVPVNRIQRGLAGLLAGEEPDMPINPSQLLAGHAEPYKHLAGKYVFSPMGWEFTVSWEEGELRVDRLFIQAAGRKRFPLRLVSAENGIVSFVCAVCDSTFFFRLEEDGSCRCVEYVFDTLKLVYEKV